MKPQSLFLALGFLAVAVFSTRCDCNKPDDNNVTPTTGCDTCSTPAFCQPFACTTKPPKCNACTTVTPGVCTATSVFKGKIDRKDGNGAVNFETSVVKAYQYIATQGVLKEDRKSVV